MSFNEVKTGDLHSWDEPNEDEVAIQGILQDYEVTNTSKGEADRYEVKTPDGTVPFFAPTILHDKLQRIGLGSLVKIYFTDIDTTNSGNDIKQFKVLEAEVNNENLEEVGLDPEEVNGDDDDGFDDVDSDDVPDL
jgi:hypothetical protein